MFNANVHTTICRNYIELLKTPIVSAQDHHHLYGEFYNKHRENILFSVAQRQEELSIENELGNTKSIDK
jgi:hypothetical protein